MSSIRLISISGLKGSGKSLFANMFVDSLNGWEVRSFAAKLKQISGILLGVHPVNFENREFKEAALPDWGITVREFLQRLGTEALRDNFDKDIWVKSLFSDYKPTSRWIICDARFLNELQAVRNKGGMCIRIDRDLPGQTDEHRSENEWKSFDFDLVIENNSTLKELNDKVIGLIKQIGL